MATPISTSTIVDVKKALHTLFSSRPALANVRVSYGYPVRQDPDEYIWIADVEGGQEAAGFRGGNHSRQEEYSVRIEVSVLRTTEDQYAIDVRTAALIAEIEDALRSDPNLNTNYTGSGTILWAQFGGITALRELVSDDGLRRESRATCAVDVAARI